MMEAQAHPSIFPLSIFLWSLLSRCGSKQKGRTESIELTSHPHPEEVPLGAVGAAALPVSTLRPGQSPHHSRTHVGVAGWAGGQVSTLPRSGWEEGCALA